MFRQTGGILFSFTIIERHTDHFERSEFRVLARTHIHDFAAPPIQSREDQLFTLIVMLFREVHSSPGAALHFY